MPEQNARRRELGAFLRARRERITPAEAGLPHTGRRRTPGLRREELALLAGTVEPLAAEAAAVPLLLQPHPADAALAALVAELHQASPEVRQWWPRYDVQERRSGHKRLRNPDGRTTDYAYTAFHLADQPDQTLVIYAAQ